LTLLRLDLAAINRQIGTKKFLMGDRITEADCMIFGMLAQFVYGPWTTDQAPLSAVFVKEFSGLGAYVQRVRDAVYPGAEWDAAIQRNIKGTTK
jgi:glutathione S-transferase